VSLAACPADRVQIQNWATVVSGRASEWCLRFCSPPVAVSTGGRIVVVVSLKGQTAFSVPYATIRFITAQRYHSWALLLGKDQTLQRHPKDLGGNGWGTTIWTAPQKWATELRGRIHRDPTRFLRQPISWDPAVGGGLEARNPGSLSVKVHHFTLASKRVDSERGFAFILDSEGRTAALSRAGAFCPAEADPWHGCGPALLTLGRAKPRCRAVLANSAGVRSSSELWGRCSL